MTQTTNFNLNIVEGTDNVNLLTQMNPNTEAIDVQMKTNEDHGIQEATELFTSTVHAITRLKPDAKVFRFTAVSNYTAGETFTVDGVQVTALLTSGEALTTGSFIIGSEVICALRDTLLTVFVNAGTASIAKNAEKLGGELPSYYGTAEDVSSAVSNAGTALETANAVSASVGNLSALTTTNKSSCVSAINEVNSNLEKCANYSLDETIIGTWIDGKPIYRKFLYTNQQIPESTDVSSLNIETMVKLGGFVNSYGNIIPIQYNDGTTRIMAFYSSGQKTIVFQSNSASHVGYVFIEYTKTTD